VCIAPQALLGVLEVSPGDVAWVVVAQEDGPYRNPMSQSAVVSQNWIQGKASEATCLPRGEPARGRVGLRTRAADCCIMER
jgi:hypothetical protein